MSSLIRRIIYNKSTRIIFYFYLTIVGLSLFFILQGYFNNLRTLEIERTSRLRAIARTTAVSLIPEEHAQILKQFPDKDDIVTVEQNPVFYRIHKQLEAVQKSNHISIPIYTLVYNAKKDCFLYIARSDKQVYYLHEYYKYPKKLKDQWDTGGILERYKTENGEWISAFEPIKSPDGKTIALIEVDEDFDHFNQIANANYYNTLIISLVVMVLMALILIPVIRRILMRDEAVLSELKQQKILIENKSREITSSVDYASTIQLAMLPEKEFLNSVFSDHFVFYRPRDIVSGDFYWAYKTEKHMFIAVSDCTGHGVPGAMMSMIGSTSLNSIVNSQPTITTSQLLKSLDDEIHGLIGSSSSGKARSDGMDISLVRIDLQTRELCYSGAFNDLLVISKDQEIIELSANRFPIGGGDRYNKTDFKNHFYTLNEGDVLYMSTDGFQDQFGGPRGKKYRKKQMRMFLQSISQLPLCDQEDALQNEFEFWKKEISQVDDVLVCGFQV